MTDGERGSLAVLLLLALSPADTRTLDRPLARSSIKRDIAHLCTDAPSASDSGPSGSASGVASSSKSPSSAAVQLASLASHSQAQTSPDSSKVHESGSSGRHGLSLPTANRSPSLLDRAQLHSTSTAAAAALPGGGGAGSGSNIFGSPDTAVAEFAHPGLPPQQRHQSQSQSHASTDGHAHVRRSTLERGDSYAQQHDSGTRTSPGFAQGPSAPGGTSASAQYPASQQHHTGQPYAQAPQQGGQGAGVMDRPSDGINTHNQQQQINFNPFALLNQAYDYSYPSNNAGERGACEQFDCREHRKGGPDADAAWSWSASQALTRWLVCACSPARQTPSSADSLAATAAAAPTVTLASLAASERLTQIDMRRVGRMLIATRTA